ncbi:hypothetical protein [Rhodopila sp.]|uniref:hypothetical protein n=1 Tax=Rhodopila sp. TaxID=2480087 RepID=UPI003D0FCB4D
MSPSVLPLISEHDYPGFQKIVVELRHTSYEEWLRDHEASKTYRKSRNGSQEIPISPQAFQEWLKARNEPAHLELLWVFAEDEAARNTRVRA